MADRDNVVLIHEATPNDNWRHGVEWMQSLPGRVVVDMVRPSEVRGVIALPTDVAAQESPDCGMVVSSGVPELAPGDFVAVRPYDGTRRENVELGGHTFAELRFYGVYAEAGEAQTYDFRESVLAKIDMSAQPILKPLGRYVVLETSEVPEATESGIYLPSDVQSRSNEAVVVAVGDRVSEVKAGQRAVYHPWGLLDFEITGYPRYRLASVDALDAILL